MRPINTCPVHNRIDAVLSHLEPFWFNGISKLAAESGVSKTAIRRLIAGKSTPSFTLVWQLAKTLEKHLGRPLNPMELVSIDGTYPTPSACELVGNCKGCTSPRVYQGRDQAGESAPDQQVACHLRKEVA